MSGNSSEKVSILATIGAIQEQVRGSDEGASVTWISRVSETVSEANVLLKEGSES
jgi:replication-associated recombination protein RarA